MEKDILSEVIEVEKEIQKCLELERAKAQEWLEKAKKESTEDFARSERGINEAFERAMVDAEKTAAAKAAEIVKEAAAQVEQLQALDERMLADTVAKQMRRILPE